MQNKPLEGLRLGLLTFALSLATFMQVLDSTIANVAIPTISGDLGASLTQGTWVITSFGVANAISIPLTGWLAKRLGEVRLFLLSTSLFVIASWLCGIAHSLEMLIVVRVLQGLVAGPIMPLSQSLLLANYPPTKRNLALSLWSMTVTVAPIFGPILGGWLSDDYHWGWIFFINIPLGILVVVTSWIILKDRETVIKITSIDKVGLVLLILGVGCLQMFLDRGKELDWFHSDEIIILATTSVICLVFLVIWELTDDNPIIDITLFKLRNFTLGCLCVSLAFMVYIGSIVLLPQILQTSFGYTATIAGLAAAPVGIIPVMLSPVIGRFGHKIDMRLLITFAFIIYSFCFFWRAYTFNIDMEFANAAWPQFVQGLAVACFFMPLTTIILSNIESSRIAAASSLSNFLRTLAGSIGTSITTTLWAQREALHHTHLTEAISNYNPESLAIYKQMQQLGMSEQQVSTYLANQITNQGLIMSANELFWRFAYIFIFLIVIIWFARPPFIIGGGGSVSKK